MIQYVFKRKEKKYLLNKEQYDRLLEVILCHMKLDEFGLHTICNLYLDTGDFRLIRKSLERPVYKEKIRLRSYGIPTEDSEVFLELKKKYKGVVYKRRVEMSLREAENYFEKGEAPCDSQVMKEIDYFMKFYERPKPKVYIAYDRMAYYSEEDENFRITFDTNIRSRFDDLSLESGDSGEELLEKDIYLMEVKAVGAMPKWMVVAMDELKIYPTSFSKYGTIYTKKVMTKCERR